MSTLRSAAGKKIYLARQFNIEIYSVDGSFEKEFYLTSTKYPIAIVDGVRDDEWLAVGDTDGVVWIVDASTERRITHFRYRVLSAFELSPSGKRATMLHNDGAAFVWVVGEQYRTEIPHGAKVISAVFKPTAQEEIVLTAGEDGMAKLWEVGGPEIRLVHVLDHQGSRVAYADFEDARGRILTMSEDGVTRIWDGNSGKLQVKIVLQKTNSTQ